MKSLFLELNEFNFDLLKEAGNELDLKNLKRLCSFYKSDTWTEDTYESDYLDPWVQWVSVHTGLPSSQHKVKHLGDVTNLQTEQLWEKLSECGVSSGIWCAMNATRGKADQCLFFLPDLWTASERAYPEELNVLLDPLRATSKNYTSKRKLEYLKDARKFLTLFKKNGLLGSFIKKTVKVILDAIRFRFKPFVFISFTDDLSANLFLKYKKRYNPDFSILFLNCLAHLQHHQWKNRKIKKSDPLAHGFRTIDRILGMLFDQLGPNDLIIVTNAFSQKNTSDEKPWILYRQIDQKKFLEAMGLHHVSVESHMTHDAHLTFPSAELAEKGQILLEGIRIQGDPLFLVEAYPDEPTKLFYRIQFTDELRHDAYFVSQGKSFSFFDLFTAIVKRTGRHTQGGTLLCNQEKFPPKLANHEISSIILDLYPLSEIQKV
ncbi:MAG: hypothetical protein COT85_06790 [Chlamydiae bacterium CG10_big_fil_rev_8_21_14_0_10_42_34]|nr:MAG: hypothetical protein COT85_06790 [Chlamydiae bacterium CG10_big_fil_rev_8_21_14_0_10_42_34]